MSHMHPDLYVRVSYHLVDLLNNDSRLEHRFFKKFSDVENWALGNADMINGTNKYTRIELFRASIFQLAADAEPINLLNRNGFAIAETFLEDSFISGIRKEVENHEPH